MWNITLQEVRVNLDGTTINTVPRLRQTMERVGAKEVRCYRSLEVDIHMVTSLIRKTPTSLRQFKDAYSPW